MELRRVLAVGLLLILALSGCSTTLRLEAFKNINPGVDVTKPGLYYVEASGGFGITALNALIYVQEEPDKDGRSVILLASGVEPSVWASILKIAVGGAFFVAGNAVYGISLEAARTLVSQAVTASGGAGGSATATGGSASTGTITNTATGQGGSATANPTQTQTSTQNPTQTQTNTQNPTQTQTNTQINTITDQKCIAVDGNVNSSCNK